MKKLFTCLAILFILGSQSMAQSAWFTSDSPRCTGETMHFTPGAPGGTILMESWDFGDGNTTNYLPPTPFPVYATHIYASPGTYTVQRTVKFDNSTVVYSLQVQVIPLPVANFSWSPANCAQPPVQFTDLSQPNGGGAIIAWSWNFGDPPSGTSNTSTLANPAHAFTAPGTYSVRLVITSAGGCTDTLTQSVPVNISPLAGFTADTACVGQATQFTDLSVANAASIVSYSWDFGDGGTSTAANPLHLYASYGTYSVIHTVVNSNGCSDSETKTVTVRPNPVANFSFPLTSCLGSPVSFTDLSSTPQGVIVQYIWDFGDGTPPLVIVFPSNPSVVHTFIGAALSHTVRLTVTTSTGCTAYVDKTVSSAPAPLANFIWSPASCQSQTVQFYDLSQTNGGGSIVSWMWNFGDPLSGVNNVSTLQNPVHAFSTSGTYNVTLIIANNVGCSDTMMKMVTVNIPPVAGFTYDTVCHGELTHFTDLSIANAPAIVSYYWDFGDGGISTLANPIHLYASYGVYQVTHTVTNSNGCSDSKTKTVSVKPNPVAGFSFTSSTCAGSPVAFTDFSFVPAGNMGFIVKWVWEFGDGTPPLVIHFPNSPNVSHTFAGSATPYIVRLTVTTSAGCSDWEEHAVTCTPTPVAAFTQSGLLCFMEPVQFTNLSQTNGGGPIVAWQWNFGDPASGMNNTSALQNPVHLFTGTGSYTISLQVTNSSGCSDTFSSTTSINLPPVANFTATTACHGQPTQFTDLSIANAPVIVSYLWDFGDGMTSAQQSPVHTYSYAGLYNVALVVVNSNGCRDTIIQPVTVRIRPVAAFSADTVVQGNPTQFTDLSYVAGPGVIVSRLWNFGDGQTSNAVNPAHTYGGPGTYQVNLTVTEQNGCTQDTTRPVLVNPVSGVPATRTVTNVIVGNGETRCYNATQQIIVAGSGTLFIVLPAGDVTFISGQHILFYPGTSVQQGGHLWGYIAPNGPWCVNPSGPVAEEGRKEKGEGRREKGEGGREKGEGRNNDLRISNEELRLTNEELKLLNGSGSRPGVDEHSVKVYPNPTGGTFVLSVEGCNGEGSVDIYDRMGKCIETHSPGQSNQVALSLGGRPSGIYLVRVTCDGWSETVRIVKW